MEPLDNIIKPAQWTNTTEVHHKLRWSVYTIYTGGLCNRVYALLCSLNKKLRSKGQRVN